MGITKNFAVFGLGRYGKSVAMELVNSGADVLAVDINQSVVNSCIKDIPYCKCADITNANVLEQLGMANVDYLIIAMANNLEASVLATMYCKELGVKNIIVKCSNELHKKILSRVGATQVVFPEQESGVRLAKNILSSGFVDIIELSKDFSMVELQVKKQWIGKSLMQLDLRKKYSINVVAIRSNDKFIVDIKPDMILTDEMSMVVVADNDKLSKI